MESRQPISGWTIVICDANKNLAIFISEGTDVEVLVFASMTEADEQCLKIRRFFLSLANQFAEKLSCNAIKSGLSTYVCIYYLSYICRIAILCLA